MTICMIVDYVDEVHFLDQSGGIVDSVFNWQCASLNMWIVLACILLSPNALRPDVTVIIDWVEKQLFIYLERLFVFFLKSPFFDGFLTIVIKPGTLGSLL